MLLGELVKSDLDVSVHWTGQEVHFDRNTSTKALKDKQKVELYNHVSLLFVIVLL